MSTTSRRNEQQQVFLRQATILRKNLYEWDRMLRSPHGEDWPSMLGRLNAAFNQAGTLDRGIEDVTEHFVYQPKKCPVNAQDVPFFLSTRLGDTATNTLTNGSNTKSTSSAGETIIEVDAIDELKDPGSVLSTYEIETAKLASRFEENMVRF